MVVNLLKQNLWLTQNILDYSKINNEMTKHFNIGGIKVAKAMMDFCYIANLELAVRRITIIELYKFTSTSKNDLHSFNKLLVCIDPYIDEKSKISEWNDRFFSLEDDIDKVKMLRNKIYAHRDSTFHGEIEYNFFEIGNLIDNCRDILSDIIMEFGWGTQLPWRYNDYNKDEMSGGGFFEKYVNF